MNAAQYIKYLDLRKHPEGGYYKQTYRSPEWLPLNALPSAFTGDRPISTAIMYLLEQDDFSCFHRIKSDECWHFYAGQTLYIHVIAEDGNYTPVRLGNRVESGDVFQFVVHAGAWFAAEPAPGTTFALTGCTVAPGFDYSDLKLANKSAMLSQYPQHRLMLERLCR